jgi:uncharacterized membrane protein YphA (DoxX/SURF4 family)
MSISFKARFERVDLRITSFMTRTSIPALRVSLGVTFFWFGILKFFPGLSPAEGMAGATIETLTYGMITPQISVPILAMWEVAIGLGLMSGRFLRTTLFLLFAQMLGAMTPLFLFPNETFTHFPYAPTLEGQYIIKNLVLVGAALVVGSTVRSGTMFSSVRPERGRGFLSSSRG